MAKQTNLLDEETMKQRVSKAREDLAKAYLHLATELAYQDAGVDNLVSTNRMRYWLIEMLMDGQFNRILLGESLSLLEQATIDLGTESVAESYETPSSDTRVTDLFTKKNVH